MRPRCVSLVTNYFLEGSSIRFLSRRGKDVVSQQAFGLFVHNMSLRLVDFRMLEMLHEILDVL